jgi:hypothetical protein
MSTAKKLAQKPRLQGCHYCADNPTCNLPARAALDGCQKWRCQVCRGPWWATSMDHAACIATGVPNGIHYRDGSTRKPLSDSSGHYMTHGGAYCEIHQSWRCLLLRVQP